MCEDPHDHPPPGVDGLLSWRLPRRLPRQLPRRLPRRLVRSPRRQLPQRMGPHWLPLLGMAVARALQLHALVHPMQAVTQQALALAPVPVVVAMQLRSEEQATSPRLRGAKRLERLP